MLAAAGVASYTVLSDIFVESGAEATNSAAYRVWLLELVETVQPIGYASSFTRSTSGLTSFGGFRSIDSAVLFHALTNGWVSTLILLFSACCCCRPVDAGERWCCHRRSRRSDPGAVLSSLDNELQHCVLVHCGGSGDRVGDEATDGQEGLCPI